MKQGLSVSHFSLPRECSRVWAGLDKAADVTDQRGYALEP